MQAHVSMARNYFTRSVFYVCFAYLSLHPQGALCSSLTCNPSSPRLESVQELVHRSGVVVEGKLQDDGQESDINAQRNAAKVNKSTTEMMNDLIDEVQEPVPNRTSDLKPHHVRVRVHQVWEIKAGGLAKDSIVSLLWYSGDNCFTLSADTRYIFFMESTNDTSVFTAAFPPVEIKRAVRKDVSKVLCQSCGRCKYFPLWFTIWHGSNRKLRRKLILGYYLSMKSYIFRLNAAIGLMVRLIKAFNITCSTPKCLSQSGDWTECVQPRVDRSVT